MKLAIRNFWEFISITNWIGKSTSVLFLVKCLEPLALLSEQESFSIQTLWKLCITHSSTRIIHTAIMFKVMHACLLLILWYYYRKRIIRIISGSKRLSHTDPLFRELGLLKLKDVNKFVIGKFMFRWYHDEVPSIFHDYFDFVKNVHNHDTRQKDHLYIPIVRSERDKSKIKIWLLSLLLLLLLLLLLFFIFFLVVIAFDIISSTFFN